MNVLFEIPVHLKLTDFQDIERTQFQYAI